MSCIQHPLALLLCSRGPPTNQGACVLHRIPGPGSLIFWLRSCSSPGESVYFHPSENTSKDTGLNLITILPFLPIRVCIFLATLVANFCQLPVNFQWEYSTYSFIFDIFGGGGKLLIFSSHILTLPPYTAFINTLKNVFSCLSYKNVKKSKCP